MESELFAFLVTDNEAKSLGNAKDYEEETTNAEGVYKSVVFAYNKEAALRIGLHRINKHKKRGV